MQKTWIATFNLAPSRSRSFRAEGMDEDIRRRRAFILLILVVELVSEPDRELRILNKSQFLLLTEISKEDLVLESYTWLVH